MPIFWALVSNDVVNQYQRKLNTTPSYVFIWLSGTLCWLGLMNWMHQNALWLVASWFFIAIVLGGGWSLFIWITAKAVLRYKLPPPVAMAATWTALEWIRSNLIVGGFPLAALEHSQYPIPLIMQSVDLFGQYGLGFAMVLAGGCAAEAVVSTLRTRAGTTRQTSHPSRFLGYSCLFLLVVLSVVTYGAARLSRADLADNVSTSTRHIALLQTATPLDVIRPCSVEDVFSDCQALTIKHSELADLVVWPESVCHLEWRYYEPGYVPQEWLSANADDVAKLLQKAQQATSEPIADLVNTSQTPLLLNLRVRDYLKTRPRQQASTNSVLFVDPHLGITARYDKVKLTPIVECDVGRHLIGRDLFTTSPCTTGTAAGIIPIPKKQSYRDALNLSSHLDSVPFYAAVNICYDSLFPHVVRRQIHNAKSRGITVDLLINVSNDMDSAYTTFVDAHLATHVFRAVENRKPYLVASNCGSSAWIDSYGRIIRCGAAGTLGCIDAKIQATNEWSLYGHYGDILPLACVAFIFGLMPCYGLNRKLRRCDSSSRNDEMTIGRPGV